MRYRIEILKGIHPGKLIDRDLKKKNLSLRSFACSIGEHHQTLSAVINGKRQLSVRLSIKIEEALGYEVGFLSALQAYYMAIELKNKELSDSISGVPKIRKTLFWDADFDTIDWGRYKDFVIQRVWERGNESEKKEIARFYGMDVLEFDRCQSSNYYKLTKSRQIHGNTAL